MTSRDDELLAHARTRIGTVLRGKYRIDRVLGVGGMGVVYAATHRNGRQLAIKMLHPELSLRADLRSRFLREGHAANAVKHAGAVAILDDDVAEDGAAFLVMELLEGETLEGIWEQAGRRLPLRSVLAVGDQLLDILAAAHERGIVHRDLKPANLFITADGALKVLDFGIARIRDVASSHATQSGMTMGTPAFMAPEQALAKTEDVGPRTDLWAVGAILYALASGRHVHEAPNAQQIVVRAATTPAGPLSAVLPNAPPAVREVVDRALAFERSERWASAVAMREAVRGAHRIVFGSEPSLTDLRLSTRRISAASGPTLPSPDVTPVPVPGDLSTAHPVSSEASTNRLPPRRGRRRRTILAAGAVAALAALAITGTFVVHRGAPSSSSSAASSTTGAAAITPAPAPSEMLPAASISASAGSTAVDVDSLPTAPKPAARGRPTKTAPAAPSTSPSSAPKPNCNPPYTIDAAGHRIPKPECD